MAKWFPCLWFDGNAEEAASFYVTLLPDSRVDQVWRSPAETPSGPAGMVLTVDFTLAGQRVQGLNGGPEFKFNEAVSFVIDCDDQAEVDRLWDALTASGGEPARVAGSRTASGCRGRSCRAGWRNCSTIPIPSVPAGRWRRCSRWARSRSLSWSAPLTRPDDPLAERVDVRRARGCTSHSSGVMARATRNSPRRTGRCDPRPCTWLVSPAWSSSSTRS